MIKLHITTSNVREYISLSGAFSRFLAELKRKADLDLTESGPAV